MRVLTGLISIGYFGLLVMGTGMLVGLPLVKLVAGDNPQWTVGVPVPVVSSEPAATVVTRWGEARLQMEDLRGSLRLPLATLPWSLFAVFWVYFGASITLVFMFLHHLRHIFKSVRDGAPFDAANALRLRWLGLLALGLALLGGVSRLITSLAVRGHVVSEHVTIPMGLSVDGSLVFYGLVLLSLAEIFRRGAELEDEQSLTV